jgi:Carboxypeptidase regulatory-like domain
VGPRLGVLAGLVWAVGGSAKVNRPAPAPLPDADLSAVMIPELVVSVVTDGALPAGTRVLLRRPGQERPMAGLGAEPPGAGSSYVSSRFRASNLQPGSARVAVEASGYEPAEAVVELLPGQPASLTIALHRNLPSGQIRGTVRSFNGRPLSATVRVAASTGDGARLTPLRSTGGSFQLDVPPGRYQVTIEAPGHRQQARTVDVEQNGVTVLNAELRRAR